MESDRDDLTPEEKSDGGALLPFEIDAERLNDLQLNFRHCAQSE